MEGKRSFERPGCRLGEFLDIVLTVVIFLAIVIILTVVVVLAVVVTLAVVIAFFYYHHQLGEFSVDSDNPVTLVLFFLLSLFFSFYHC